ncbi:MAG TPA: ABC transporter permease subunit [Fimbriimonadaceae bacterium]|nr:ABC transporter permease subunit [Fimbriimonadaceae bacterium]
MSAIFAIASTTIGEAVRRRVLLIILMIGVLLLSIIPSLSVLSPRAEMSTMIATMYAVLRGTSALIAIVLTIYMIPNEIERRTIYTILSKPVQRWQFLVGKYLGAVAAIALMILLMSAVMILLFYIFQRPDMERLIDVAKQPVFYFLEMSLLAAVALFFSTFTTPLVNFFLSIGLWGVGTVLNPLYSSIAGNSQAHPVMQGVSKFVTSILPNFANYDIKNPIINPGQEIQHEGFYFFYVVGYGIVYIVILIVAGMLIFDRREV